MEHLADRDGMIAEFAEMLRHRDRLRINLPELLAQAPDSGGVRPLPQHDARAGRCAGRRLTEGAREGRRAGREAIEIGRLDYGVSITAQLGP